MNRFLGFDVGTKDLAHCLLEVESLSLTELALRAPVVRVLQWEVVDIRGRYLSETMHNATVWFRREILGKIQPPPTACLVERQFKRDEMVTLSGVLLGCLECAFPGVSCGLLSSSQRFRHIESVFDFDFKAQVAHNNKQHNMNTAQRRTQVKHEAVALTRHVLQMCQDTNAMDILNNASFDRRDDFADSFLIALTCALLH